VLAEFEEKTYEQHLTFELIGGRNLFFPPGQVLEGKIGFDVALLTKNRSFWKNFPNVWGPWWYEILFHYPPGTGIPRKLWQELQRNIEYFPKFKFNCFIQAKRPEYMIGFHASEYSSWNKPYFRYDLNSSQQNALEFLAQETNKKALVIYACPTFYTLSDYWKIQPQKEGLIRNSNFCEVEKLKGNPPHHRYSFTEPGNKGVAHSDPEPIESIPLDQALEELQRQEPSDSNLAFLSRTAELTHSASERLGNLGEAYSLIERNFSQITEGLGPLAKALGRIQAFQLVSNVNLLIGY
jgi:hypothetical protein